MNAEVKGSPSFAYLDVTLEPGERIVGESDAMSSMAADLDVKAKFNGGFFPAILKRVFGGESLFINEYENKSAVARSLTLVQGVPGDVLALELSGNSVCLQPGAFVAAYGDVSLKTRWAGFVSFIAREGLFKLKAEGSGIVYFGAYGGLVEKEVDGELVIDTAHLVAYEPQMKLKMQLAGGIFGSFFGGEGLVTRVEGKGKVWIQTRSLSGLAGWLNPKL